MKRTIMFILWFTIIAATDGICQETIEQNRTAKTDSILDGYSVEEVLQYKSFYESQIDKIEKEKRSLREKGIRDALEFLKNNPKSKILDKVYIRLAELYYQKSTEKYLEEMQAYDDYLEKQETGAEQDTFYVEPVKDYSTSLALYQKIIDEYPQSVLLDDAIYNKAFILEETNDFEDAVPIYNELIEEFPESRYVPEALMRMAEYYFNPPINDIEKSVELYKKILEFKDSPKYDEALYRLGWSYYRLSQYPEAVSYFTLLADDVEKADNLDPEKKFTNPALRDESIEYIGISFLDYGGAERAAEFIESIGGRDYGHEILMKIGDVYKDEKEEYETAIETYGVLLRMYPEHPVAPDVQWKIVECFRHMKDDMRAYLARDKLFNLYKPGSPWWQANNNEKARQNAYSLSEKALRDNISLLYSKAGMVDDKDLYLQAVSDNQKYLRSFPTDTNAVQIHWNMALTLDTKLHDYDRAFEEYMKICDLYWKSKYQEDAAKNAIALAKDAVTSDTTKKAVVSNPMMNESTSNVLKAVNYQRLELTPNEQKLARAYDNYIRLFPHKDETAMILTNAGALYYNNNQFPEALKYFNTHIKHFPNDKDADYAKYMVMEAYFGKRDFRSAEIVARRLKNGAHTDSSYIVKAKKRLAESIFLSAEVYADSANHLAAGNEYLRMVREVPDAEFADLGMFNAALEYDKAKEYSRAVETYNYLLETKSNSKYKFDAMNNLAFDYGELHEYKNAGLTYEKLSRSAPDSATTYDALYNASIFFVKGQEWEDAIRINQSFVSKFPKSPDADNLFFDIATYYLKLDDLENANAIYGEYVMRYPNSPRVVETYFHRGEYYQDNGDADKAIAEYKKAVQKNDEFKKKSITSNDFFAAEASFKMTMLQYEKYRQIGFYLPQAAMAESKNRKKELLKQVIDGFTNVVSYGTLRLYEATYYIGDSYEEFAETWVRQEIPHMEENKKIFYQKQINQTAAELYGRAEDSYKQAVNILSRLADQYQEELIASDSTSVESTERQLKIVNEDSTLRVAKKWTDRCKEKISEVIYDIAELNSESVKLFLDAPIPDGLDDVAALEYRKQILAKAVAPLITQISADHKRNVKEAWDMGLENQWVKLSRNKIITVNNLLSDEYQKMAFRALDLYGKNSTNYKRATENEGVGPNGEDAIDVSERMANLLDFGKIFATVALELKRTTLEKAIEDNISDPAVTETKEILLKNIYAYSQICDSLAVQANTNRKLYENKFKETDSPEFEDALFTYEDNLYSLKESLTELLESAYETSESMQIKSPWATRVLLSLARLDPVQYSGLLNLKMQGMDVATDQSWIASTAYTTGWTNRDFDDSSWEKVSVVGTAGTNGEERQTIWLTVTDTLNVVPVVAAQTQTQTADSTTSADMDSSVVDQHTLAASRAETSSVRAKRIFVRKTFYIEGLPVSAELKLIVDDSYNLFLNGEYMANFAADSTEWQNERTHLLGDFLKSGKNVLAIELKDEDMTGGGFQASMHIESLPEWDRVKEKYEMATSDAAVRQNLILDKNIILF